MTKILNEYGVEICFEAAAHIMDEELCEALHSKGYDSDKEFFDAYAVAHLAKFGEEFEPNKLNGQW